MSDTQPYQQATHYNNVGGPCEVYVCATCDTVIGAAEENGAVVHAPQGHDIADCVGTLVRTVAKMSDEMRDMAYRLK